MLLHEMLGPVYQMRIKCVLNRGLMSGFDGKDMGDVCEQNGSGDLWVWMTVVIESGRRCVFDCSTYEDGLVGVCGCGYGCECECECDCDDDVCWGLDARLWIDCMSVE